MSTEPEKNYPPKFDPTLTFRGEQYFLSLQDQNGTVYEKIVSPSAVREAFTNEVVDSGWLQPEVRRWGVCRWGEWMCCFIAPQRHTLSLESHEEGAERGVVMITAPLPGLVFFGCANKYFVWAVKTREFDPKAEVYHAPLPNVGGDTAIAPPGLICYGLYKPLKCRAATVMQAFRLFIETPFNNHTADGKSRKYPEDVREMLRELAKGEEGNVGIDFKETAYPVEDLVPLAEGRPVTVELLIRTWILDDGASTEGIEASLLELIAGHGGEEE